ncbi:hypothetical protein [uncultured Ruminococcus sp.]|uniref:hypothetical protein n=1 Tax=uncultured Ruminococcus sp. TaxID=165186 RepID=UPI0025F26ABA|nr:hypothetical protein [uncultured Ruminococcus sp.]
MRKIPDYFWEWTEYVPKYKIDGRFVKENIPPEILAKKIADEKLEFESTDRRTVINVDLTTGAIIPIEKAIKLYKQFEAEKIKRIREEMRQEQEMKKTDIYKTPEYQAYIERISAPPATRKVTPEELAERLKEKNNEEAASE